MSTATPLMEPGVVADYARALREWPTTEVNHADFVLAASPFTTLYFLYDPERLTEVSEALVDIHERFESLTGRPYRIATHPATERPHPYGSKRLPDLRTVARATPLDKQFVFSVSDEKNPLSSPAHAGYFWRASTWDKVNNNTYSRVQLYYGWQWWLDHRDEWRRFVLEVCDQLNVEQAYSGFSMANPLDIGSRYEVAVWERALAPHFFGLDIDFPFSMARTLQDGIRPPTWAFLLSDRWRDKLGLTRAQVRAALDDPRIRIDDLACGQWIELGDKPDLLPVENGVPELQVRLNRLLKPIRNDDLGLVGFGQWDGDPNVRFDRADSRRWLARFDEDSDWPDAATRRAKPAASATTRPGSTPAGQPCPRSGWWFSPARVGSRRLFTQGEPMPELGGDFGSTLWQWDEDQGS